MHQLSSRSPHRLWAYTYLIQPPAGPGLRTIRTMVNEENAAARAAVRGWTGKLVQEALVTFLLVVSETNGQTMDINRRLEAELRRLKATFLVTTPMEIRRIPEPQPAAVELLHSGYRHSLN